MATNKNQHFVPRCHLRPFSKAGEGAAINLYNIDRKRFIQDAPVKNQCSRDYFYGKDQVLEKAIQSVEGAYAQTLSNILQAGFHVTDKTREVLRVFWLMQHMRTEAAAKRAAAWSVAMANRAGVDESSFRLEIKEAVRLGMLVFASEMHAIDDVKICLLRNCTGIPFVTSDDPAVLTNRWNLIDPKRAAQTFGIGSAGNLFLLPLSPEVLCLGYDGDVYSVAHENGWVRIRRESDIDAFNEHQFLNCRANIYVRDAGHESYVHDAFRRFAANRLKERHRVHYAVVDGDPEDHQHYKIATAVSHEANRDALVHLQVWHPTPASWPRQIAWRPFGGCAYTNGTAIGYLRRAHLTADAQPPYRKIRVP